MTAGSTKVAGDLPVFIKAQPLRCPRNDRFGNRLLRRPRHFLRVVKAKIRAFRPALVRINVRQHAVVVQGLGPDRRGYDLGGEKQNFKKTAVEKFFCKKKETGWVNMQKRP